MNITSMMDVVFMLLIIFMIAAPLMEAQVDIKLPKSSAAKVKDENAITVSITEGGRIFIGKSEVELDEFEKRIGELAEAGGVSAVSLKGDEGVDYGIVMRVVGYIKEAGIENLGLVAIPEKSGR